MNYFCLQTHSKGCGFACVKMLLANTFKNPDYLNITEDLNPYLSIFITGELLQYANKQ